MSLDSRGRAIKVWLVILALVLSDSLLALLSWGGAYALHGVLGRAELSNLQFASIFPTVVVFIWLRALMGLYPGYGLSQAEELRRQTYSVFATLATIAVFALALQSGDLLSRLLLGLGFLILLPVTPLVRYCLKWGMMRIGLWGKPVVILGAGEDGRQLVWTLRREWGLGFRPVAVFDFRLAPRGGRLEGVPYGGTVTDALDLAWKHDIDTAIFAMPHIRRKYLAKFIDKASYRFKHVIVIPELGVNSSTVVARDFMGIFGIEIKHNLLNPWILRAKRTLDIGATIIGAILLLPLLLTICLFVWVSTGGYLFYRAQRIGRGGKSFWCLKFRTMVPDAEAVLQRLLEENIDAREEYMKYHKLRGDPRVTRVGRFLRSTSLDELPQLWNVLRGEMSLVGPRPIVEAEIEKYGSVFTLYKRVTPGISGLWQVSGRNDTSYEERVAMDVYYVRNWSIWLDFIILARTLTTVIFRQGAY
jgi:Undecaprenyl-phosphate galactose phosphotransferase WbaP